MTDEKPIREQLLLQADRGKMFMTKEKIQPGMVKFFSGTTRLLLSKVLSTDSPALGMFDPQDVGKSESEHAEILATRVAALTRIIAEFDTVGSRCGVPQCVFFGHGRSGAWRELKDFVSDRLHLPWDEFNREPVAGFSTFERLSNMLDSASFALLVMTGEDVTQNNELQARQNVVHEVGLFQGRLGPRSAIVLMEEGCQEFSNIVGLSQIRFPPNDIRATFEEVRRVLEREGLIQE